MVRFESRVLLLLLLAGIGCRRAPAPAAPPSPPPQVRVIGVAVTVSTQETPEAAAQAQLPLAELEKASCAGLRRAGILVAVGEPARPRGDYKLRLDLGLAFVPPSSDSEGRSLLRAQVRGTLQAEHPAPELEPPRLDAEVRAEKVLTGIVLPSSEAWLSHARRAAEDSSALLGAQLKLLEADNKTLLATMMRQDLDTDLRGVAIQVLGLRKERQAVPTLVALLRDPDGDLRDRAIGGLIAIGDRSAVKPLAASAQFSDTVELDKILEAVAYLGGAEARSYLSFVAAGHQSEQIRAAAQSALAHLEQHEAEANTANRAR